MDVSTVGDTVSKVPHHAALWAGGVHPSDGCLPPMHPPLTYTEEERMPPSNPGKITRGAVVPQRKGRKTGRGGRK